MSSLEADAREWENDDETLDNIMLSMSLDACQVEKQIFPWSSPS